MATLEQPHASTSAEPLRTLRPRQSYNSLGVAASYDSSQSLASGSSSRPARRRQPTSKSWKVYEDGSLGEEIEEGSVYEQEEYGFEDREFPRSGSSQLSPSASFASSPSIDLAAPMPSPFFIPTSKQAQVVRQAKENPATRRGLQPPSPIKIAPPPAQTNQKPLVTHHVKVGSRISSEGFPYRTSILQTQAAIKSGNKIIFDPNRQPGNRDSSGTTSTTSWTSSNDVDLDISFDFHSTAVWDDSELSYAAQGERPRSPHGVPEGEMVRSPSGRLVGTKKRVRSAVELRAQFIAEERRMREQVQAAEEVAIEMLAPEDVEEEHRTAHAAQAARKGSAASGFSFNTTNPMLVPLPDSPLTMDSPTLGSIAPRPAKVASLGRSVASPLASPAWSITSFFTKSSRAEDPGSSKTTWSEWAKGKGRGHTQATPSWSESPMFSSFGGGTHTAPTTPNDTPVMVQLEEDEDEGVEATLRRAHKMEGLHGLGFDFIDGDEEGDADDEGPRKVAKKRDGSKHKKGHAAAIPSLSITFALDRPSTESPGQEWSDIALADQSDDNLHPNRVRSPSPSPSATPRVGSPEPAHQLASPLSPIALQTHRHQEATSSEVDPLAKPSWRASVHSFLSLASLADHLHHSTPGLATLETVEPAKLLFVLGFVMGPWMWIVGGWGMRNDGEMWGQRGLRCKLAGCGCGAIKIPARGPQMRGNGEVEEWVRRCRVASVASGTVVTALTVTAVWAVAAF